MLFRYVKPLKSSSLISEFEKTTGFFFPHSFRKIVKRFNGGRPERYIIKTPQRDVCIKRLLSFNKADKESVWSLTKSENGILSEKYIPFAIDNFGNLICFSSNCDETDTVVFIDHETACVTSLADDFDEFLNNLSSE